MAELEDPTTTDTATATSDSITTDPTNSPATNLTTCLSALNASQNFLFTSEDELESQRYDLGYTSDAVYSILTILLHTLFIVLLIDRIALLKHRPTKIAFWVSIAAQNVYNLFNIFSDSVPYWESNAGVRVYYYIRATVLPINQWAIVYLLYLRVRDSLLRTSTVWRMCALVATHMVLPLEWLKQFYAVGVEAVNDDYVYPYPAALMMTTTAYRILLDVGFSLYSFWMYVYETAGGRAAARTKTKWSEKICDKAGRQQYSRSSSSSSPLMSEDTAFLVGYASRAVLFLALDVLFVVITEMDMSFSELGFREMTIWACAQALSPIKPYLIVTDMARIRALSAERPAATSVTSGGGGGKTRTAAEKSAKSVVGQVAKTTVEAADDVA
ncbi:hypothetical protein HDU86_004379 [Geranomyces michiganensis]|nr:hypothetical protein HDU86_004379 [Geranomyces michiganensis]